MIEFLQVDMSDLLAVVLASYGVIELIESEIYGPYDILKQFKMFAAKVMGKYCQLCFLFWVGAYFTVSPSIFTYPMAAIGFKFVVDYMLVSIGGQDA